DRSTGRGALGSRVQVVSLPLTDWARLPPRGQGGSPMKRPRWKRLRWLALLLLAPPALWGLVLAVIPTGWAKARLVAQLQQATGQPVRLGSLRMGPLGGVRLGNLEIGEPVLGDAPWLRVATLR